jgi:transcriptional regulator with XRE-family HTH domain
MDVTLRQRRLVAAVQKLRDAAGLSLTECAERAGWSASKLSRAETLQSRLSGDDIHHVCTTVFNLDRQATDVLVALARRQRERGWWQVYGRDMIGAVADLIELESDASAEREFLIDLVPGLLQTADYARAVIGPAFPREGAERIDERVEIRLARQQRLRDGGLDLWVVIDELALLRPVGGATVMAAQLDHLAEMAEHPAVTLQVLPREVQAHAAFGAPFRLFTLGAENYAHVDNLRGGSVIDDPTEVALYLDVWQRVTAVAADFARSVKSVVQAAKAYREEE